MEKLTGIHAVREALAAGRPLQTVIVGREHHGSRLAEIVSLAKRNGVPVRFEDRAQLDRAAGTRDHQGVVALVAARSSMSLEDVLAQKGTKSAPGLLVILDGVEDPQNLGAIIRTALAAGADGVIIPERRAAGLTEAAARASAGAVAHLPVARVKNIARTMEELKESGSGSWGWMNARTGGTPKWIWRDPSRWSLAAKERDSTNWFGSDAISWYRFRPLGPLGRSMFPWPQGWRCSRWFASAPGALGSRKLPGLLTSLMHGTATAKISHTSLGFVLNQREYVEPGKSHATCKKRQLDGKRRAHHRAAQFSHQLYSRRSRSTGRQKIIANKDGFSGPDGVLVNLKGVRAIFQVIGDLSGFPREFPRFPHGHEPRAQPVRERRRQDEPPRLDTHYDVDYSAGIMAAQAIHQDVEAVLVLEQSSQIVKENAGFGIIGNFADQRFQVIHALFPQSTECLFVALS